MTHWNYLAKIVHHQQGFIKQKLSLFIIVILSQNSTNTAIVIAIIDKIVVTGD